MHEHTSVERRQALDWVIQALSVNPEDVSCLTEDLIAMLVRDPRAGIQRLLLGLGRQQLPIAELLVQAEQLQQAVGRLESLRDSDRIERGMASLGAALEGKAAEQGLSATRLSALLEPVRIVAANARNPFKQAADLRSSVGDLWQYVPSDDCFFAYDVLQNQHYNEHAQAAARYVPVWRLLQVPEQLNPQNMLSMLMVYHEMVHLKQDNSDRQTYGSQYIMHYKQLAATRIGGRPIDRINNEAEAYGQEIDALNLLMDGRLRTGELLHPGAVPELMLRLKASFQTDVLQTLLWLAEAYYSNDPALPPFPYPGHFLIRCIYMSQIAGKAPVLLSGGNGFSAMEVNDRGALGPSRFEVA